MGRESTIGLTVKALFDDYLAVEGSTAKHPYARPFASSGEEVFGRNVAGSYSWSSIRNVLGRVVEERAGQDPDYALRPRHSDLARDALLKGKRLPADSLIAFLYRDLAFQADTPSFAPLQNRFALEFDFRAEGGGLTSDFRDLLTGIPEEVNADEWFESYESDASSDTNDQQASEG